MLLDFIQIDPSQVFMLSITAFIMGVAKMGFPGLNIIPIIIMIYLYGPQFSLGFTLLIGYVSDWQSTYSHRKHINFGIYSRFIGWCVLGVIISGIIGSVISTNLFKVLISVFILLSTCLLAYQELKKLYLRRKHHEEGLPPTKPKITKASTLFSATYGILSGSSSMLANSSAPFTSFYLLHSNIPTPNFMGTSALLYLSYNTIKIIIHLFLWKSITLITLYQSLTFLPLCLLGAIMTRKLVYKVPQQIYRLGILLLTAITGVGLLLTLYI